MEQRMEWTCHEYFVLQQAHCSISGMVFSPKHHHIDLQRARCHKPLEHCRYVGIEGFYGIWPSCVRFALGNTGTFFPPNIGSLGIIEHSLAKSSEMRWEHFGRGNAKTSRIIETSGIRLIVSVLKSGARRILKRKTQQFLLFPRNRTFIKQYPMSS